MEYGTAEEKRRFEGRAWLCVGFAVLVWALVVLAFPQFFGAVFFRNARSDLVPPAFYSVELALSGLACGFLARSRGYSWILGIAGTLCCVGFVIVALLPDRWAAALRRDAEVAPPSERSNYPR